MLRISTSMGPGITGQLQPKRLPADAGILELMLLKESGIAAADIYLTVGADLVARRDHALLSVLIGNSMWALDQRASAPFLTTSMTDFRPILTMRGAQIWLHGFKIKSRG
jgi:hypothetical protein